MLISASSYAQLTNVRVAPAQAAAFVGQDFVVNLNWHILEDGQSNGAISPRLLVINPRNGSQIGDRVSTIGATGSGPYVFSETIQFNASDIDAWNALGLNFVLFKRTFDDGAGSTIEGQLRVNINSGDLGRQRSGGQGYLDVQSLRLEFENGNDLAVVERRAEVRAKLVVDTRGQGLLEGRWQVAEPGASGAVPIFRTLSLVRQNIQQGQRVSLLSPRLPTSQVGKFLLRFCVQRDRTELREELCTEPKRTALAAYQVQGEENPGVQALVVQSPIGGRVNQDTRFVWQGVQNAAVYQLQIFELNSRATDLPSSELKDENLTPTFVTGMVLPGNTPNTKLSELVESNLVKGRSYLWRVTAQNAAGQLVGVSHEQTFVYR